MLEKSHGNDTLVFTPQMEYLSFKQKYDCKMSIPVFVSPKRVERIVLRKLISLVPKRKKRKTVPKKELFEKIYFSRSTPTQSPFLIITSLCKLGKYLGKEKNIQLNCPNGYFCSLVIS